MDYKTDNFIRKFNSAQECFNNESLQSIVSIKFRDDCVNNSEYSHFIDELKHNLNLDVKPLGGDFQGRAWLISDDLHNNVILVEHETGLEILYIAGSIASLVSLIPLIASGWKFFRGKFSNRHHYNGKGTVEIRKLNSENILNEQQIQSIENYILISCLEENKIMKEKLEMLEKEVKSLKEIIVSKNGTSKKTKKITNKEISNA